MNHDRIHARTPKTDLDRWQTGTITAVGERDGHAVFTVALADPEATDTDELDSSTETVELTVTHAVRDLVVSRLDGETEESPVGELVWFRRRGGA